MQKGLLQRHREATLAAREYRNRQDAAPNPHTAHDENIAAIMSEREAGDIAEAIEAVEAVRMHCGDLIRDLGKIRLRSPHITLALRHLEDAESRLIRELGS